MMTGTPLAEDVTGILKQITDSTTNIYLRACTSSGAAESLSILLPGTHVEGCVAPALSIPFTYQAISMFPGPDGWPIYTNGTAKKVEIYTNNPSLDYSTHRTFGGGF